MQDWEPTEQSGDFSVFFQPEQAEQKITQTIRLISFHEHRYRQAPIRQCLLTCELSEKPQHIKPYLASQGLCLVLKSI